MFNQPESLTKTNGGNNGGNGNNGTINNTLSYTYGAGLSRVIEANTIEGHITYHVAPGHFEYQENNDGSRNLKSYIQSPEGTIGVITCNLPFITNTNAGNTVPGSTETTQPNCVWRTPLTTSDIARKITSVPPPMSRRGSRERRYLGMVNVLAKCCHGCGVEVF